MTGLKLIVSIPQYPAVSSSEGEGGRFRSREGPLVFSGAVSVRDVLSALRVDGPGGDDVLCDVRLARAAGSKLLL